MNKEESLIRVSGLSKEFDVGKGFLSKGKKLKAVDQVSLEIRKGETLGMVGESGCGKSTLGRCILRLIEPTGGEVFYQNQNLLELDQESMRRMRRRLQIIFQDPYASLNPRMTVMEIIKAPLDVFRIGTPGERVQKVMEESGKSICLDIRMNSRAVRGSGLLLPGRWFWIRNSSYVTSRSLHWMFPYEARF